MGDEPQESNGEGVYTDGFHVMSERDMLERLEAWYDNLSPRDQKKFTDRLWAAITEESSVEGPQDGTEAEGAGTPPPLEGPGPDSSDRPQPDP